MMKKKINIKKKEKKTKNFKKCEIFRLKVHSGEEKKIQKIFQL
jgi:hypothetical protein